MLTARNKKGKVIFEKPVKLVNQDDSSIINQSNPPGVKKNRSVSLPLLDFRQRGELFIAFL